MLDKSTGFWTELAYQFDEISNCIHLKAFLASLPVAYTAHFLGDWHLLEVWFSVACVDLVMGIILAIKVNNFSWDKIGAWTFKILVHACTIIAVGILAHVASIALQYDILILNIYLAILIAKELGSIVRNMRAMKWPVPKILTIIVATFDRNAEKHITDILDKAFQVDEQKQEPKQEPKPKQEKDVPDDLHSR